MCLHITPLTHIHVPAILCIRNMYSYLKVELILEGGVEVATLISYPNLEECRGSSRRHLGQLIIPVKKTDILVEYESSKQLLKGSVTRHL